MIKQLVFLLIFTPGINWAMLPSNAQEALDSALKVYQSGNRLSLRFEQIVQQFPESAEEMLSCVILKEEEEAVVWIAQYHLACIRLDRIKEAAKSNKTPNKHTMSGAYNLLYRLAEECTFAEIKDKAHLLLGDFHWEHKDLTADPEQTCLNAIEHWSLAYQGSTPYAKKLAAGRLLRLKRDSWYIPLEEAHLEEATQLKA